MEKLVEITKILSQVILKKIGLGSKIIKIRYNCIHFLSLSHLYALKFSLEKLTYLNLTTLECPISIQTSLQESKFHTIIELSDEPENENSFLR